MQLIHFAFCGETWEPIKLTLVVDEDAQECLAAHALRRILGKDAMAAFATLVESHGIPDHIQSDNGTEMVAKTLPNWMEHPGIKTIYITPGNRCDNLY
jgi:putative transposase